jgi:hypothetical protein
MEAAMAATVNSMADKQTTIVTVLVEEVDCLICGIHRLHRKPRLRHTVSEHPDRLRKRYARMTAQRRCNLATHPRMRNNRLPLALFPVNEQVAFRTSQLQTPQLWGPKIVCVRDCKGAAVAGAHPLPMDSRHTAPTTAMSLVVEARPMCQRRNHGPALGATLTQTLGHRIPMEAPGSDQGDYPRAHEAHDKIDAIHTETP